MDCSHTNSKHFEQTCNLLPAAGTNVEADAASPTAGPTDIAGRTGATANPKDTVAKGSAPKSQVPDVAFNLITRIAVLYWREVCNNLNLGDYSAVENGKVVAPENPGPGYGTRAYAIQYVALYDALAGIIGEPTYLTHTLPSMSKGEVSACR
jgi:hypothetical protein